MCMHFSLCTTSCLFCQQNHESTDAASSEVLHSHRWNLPNNEKHSVVYTWHFLHETEEETFPTQILFICIFLSPWMSVWSLLLAGSGGELRPCLHLTTSEQLWVQVWTHTRHTHDIPSLRPHVEEVWAAYDHNLFTVCTRKYHLMISLTHLMVLTKAQIQTHTDSNPEWEATTAHRVDRLGWGTHEARCLNNGTSWDL